MQLIISHNMVPIYFSEHCSSSMCPKMVSSLCFFWHCVALCTCTLVFLSLSPVASFINFDVSSIKICRYHKVLQVKQADWWIWNGHKLYLWHKRNSHADISEGPLCTFLYRQPRETDFSLNSVYHIKTKTVHCKLLPHSNLNCLTAPSFAVKSLKLFSVICGLNILRADKNDGQNYESKAVKNRFPLKMSRYSN